MDASASGQEDPLYGAALVFAEANVKFCVFQQFSVFRSWWVTVEEKRALGFSARMLTSFAGRAVVTSEHGFKDDLPIERAMKVLVATMRVLQFIQVRSLFSMTLVVALCFFSVFIVACVCHAAWRCTSIDFGDACDPSTATFTEAAESAFEEGYHVIAEMDDNTGFGTAMAAVMGKFEYWALSVPACQYCLASCT